MTKVLGKYVIIDRADVGKTTQDLLRDLLYESTGARIPKDKIRYGKPQELDQRPGDKFDPNTFIPVIVDIVYDTRFRTDGDGFMYRRRSIIEHTSGIDFTKIAPEFFPFRTSDIIDQVNSYLPYPIAMDELVEYEYSTPQQWAKGVNLTARADSYLWFDGKAIEIDSSLISHENLLSNTVLNGFNIYQPPNGPLIIPGFTEHRGGCGQESCPICSTTGRITSDTPKHIVSYIEMVGRDQNTSFKNPPTNNTPLPVTPGNSLTIKPPTQSIERDEPPTLQFDDRPEPVNDGVASPYQGSEQRACGEDVNLEYYAPRPEPVDPTCSVDGNTQPLYPDDTAGSCSNNAMDLGIYTSDDLSQSYNGAGGSTSGDCDCGGTCGSC